NAFEVLRNHIAGPAPGEVCQRDRVRAELDVFRQGAVAATRVVELNLCTSDGMFCFIDHHPANAHTSIEFHRVIGRHGPTCPRRNFWNVTVCGYEQIETVKRLQKTVYTGFSICVRDLLHGFPSSILS